MRNPLNHWSIGTLTLAIVSCGAVGDVSTYTSDISLNGGESNYASFNGLAEDQSLTGYQEDGLEVSVNRDYFSWNAPGFDGSEMFYANTGSFELVSISLVNGEDFGDMEMQVSSGWSPVGLGTMYLWIQLYSDGGLVSEIDLDATTGEYVGLVGGGFDQVLIGSFATGGLRDEHNTSNRNAIALDNIRVGTVVPAPGTLAVAALGLIGLRRRRG